MMVSFLFLFFSFTYVWADVSVVSESQTQNSFSSSVAVEICHALENTNPSFQIASENETTTATEQLRAFYKRSQCSPVWSHEHSIDADAILLVYALRDAQYEGLNTQDPRYNLESLIVLLNSIQSDASAKNHPKLFAQLDVLLSDAYFVLGKDLYEGLTPRKTATDKWRIDPKKSLNLALYLENALANNTVDASIKELSPSSSGYQALKSLLMKYYKLQEAGGWKEVASSDTPEEIKERLRIEGYLGADESSDEGYIEALKNFQKHHGIKSDGVIGTETLARMNISVEEKILSIRLNMERWRWMPSEMENSYVSVNIPNFSLRVVENNETLLQMKTVVGKDERPTPIFNAMMSYIVINPYWSVPPTIIREDLVPAVRKNINYLKKNNIRVFKNGDNGEKNEINPSSIDWKHINANGYPYSFRQDSGDKNALGRIKFIFPNPYDVYIHDTPHKELFKRKERSFSSGCIRIEEPLNLATYLLNRETNGSTDINVSALIAANKKKTITLSKKIKVYINYWTVWADDEGNAEFRDDLYGYDRELAEILGWR
ncbi:L,D-transpeptidase family protein [Sulfuricurvum sp.]|uniref:L,D-transpeptidase family protein n=1 Tax=Sulfuricurvum sp. TaxID=2025608 RepID=UPI002D498C61|nr:L,D-transpeptidase family protein [Sulfuricurvum sp.]HZF71123.1 L,D-transpeptidase family protein [Sulfuricurvum sp.]